YAKGDCLEKRIEILYWKTSLNTFSPGILWWIFYITIVFSLYPASAVAFFQRLRINVLNPVDIFRY
ncbi:MAG: hypothetical protein ACNA7V_11110, partial [Bacteroidales bacterium]